MLARTHGMHVSARTDRGPSLTTSSRIANHLDNFVESQLGAIVAEQICGTENFELPRIYTQHATEASAIIGRASSLNTDRSCRIKAAAILDALANLQLGMPAPRPSSRDCCGTRYTAPASQVSRTHGS